MGVHGLKMEWPNLRIKLSVVMSHSVLFRFMSDHQGEIGECIKESLLKLLEI